MHNHILIVDDDKVVTALMKKILTQDGYSVHSAANGRQALAQMQRLNPDLIILDLVLPDMTGRDLLRITKQDPERKSIPLLVLTAARERRHEWELLGEGADDYLTKPFDARVLSARVQALIRRAKRHDRSPERIDLEGLSINAKNRVVYCGDAPVGPLSPKEFDILYLLGAEYPNAVDRQTISHKVWGKALDETHERSIDVHVRKLRVHLQDQPRIRIEALTGKGYMLKVG